ncbi:hypothetical protein [Paenibacillus sp. J2TS4]|uniref:hypothetical protein n=1 Tax=Paenibacillus sp. J2TS4 TaxID=2807194 RepID=UPI001B28ECAE|nr:hypothetical protein [Paenibacillus sp. J2TS4]GIP33048.1 hypothetical protein J2TS4_22580 [Paenibacillus sp. J2TS4]
MSDDKNVIRFPISYDQRMKNQRGVGYVPCEVSSRYLLFNNYVDDNGLIMMNVRTNNGGSDRKLCDMVVHFDDLVELVNSVYDSRKNK